MEQKEAAAITTSTISATKEDMEIAFHGQAVFSNKMFATNTASGVRIAFCENQLPEVATPVFRTAVLLSYPDAIALRDLISHQLKGLSFVELKPETSQKDG